MKRINKKGFTLIELLVVITIIGILATGAVGVFTTQLQGARDSTRINNMKVMETALHQLFNDNGQYPIFTNSGTFKDEITPFLSKNLKDPKEGLNLCWASDTTKDICNGYYNSIDDSFGLPYGAFKLGVRFEKKTNYEQKAHSTGKDTDGGNINDMYELFAGSGGSGVVLNNSNIVY